MFNGKQIQLPERIKKVAAEFGGRPVYIVGGYVRNKILGIGNTDIDLASSLMPEEILDIFGDRAKLVNEKLGTVHIKCGDEIFEHTTFRTESYPQGGYHTPDTVKIGVSLEEDAFRRDFTMNALYADIYTGEIIDPTGRGVSDVLHRMIMTTTPDPYRIMNDDGLRLLRMVRLAGQLDFFIEDELMACAKNNVDLLDAISKERIYKELQLILMADTKHECNNDGHRRALLYMKYTGLLKKVFPIYPFVGGEEKDVYMLIDVCTSMPQDFTLRLAALFLLEEHYVARNTLINLKAENDRTDFIASVIAYKDYARRGLPSDADIRKQIQRMGKKQFQALTTLRRSEDMETGKMGNWRAFMDVCERMEEENYPFTAGDLAVDGRTIMRELGLRPGRQIGYILSKLLEWCAEDASHNEKQKLLQKAREIMK